MCYSISLSSSPSSRITIVWTFSSSWQHGIRRQDIEYSVGLTDITPVGGEDRHSGCGMNVVVVKCTSALTPRTSRTFPDLHRTLWDTFLSACHVVGLTWFEFSGQRPWLSDFLDHHVRVRRSEGKWIHCILCTMFHEPFMWSNGPQSPRHIH